MKKFSEHIKPNSLRTRVGVVIFITTLFLAIVSLLLQIHTDTQEQYNYTVHNSILLANIASSRMDIPMLKQFIQKVTASSHPIPWEEVPAEIQKYNFLLSKIQSDSGILSLNVVVPTDDKLLFIVGNHDDETLNPGQTISENIFFSSQQEKTAIENGELTTFTLKNVHDGIDKLISTFVPVHDTDGHFLAYINVETNMDPVDNVNDFIYQKATIALLFVVLFFIVSSSFFFQIKIVWPILYISQAAIKFAKTGIQKGESHIFDQLNLDTKDELSDLLQSLQIMEGNINSQIQDTLALTAEKVRFESELSIASRIQLNMLPQKDLSREGMPGFELHALLHPAKNVSGDFYEFFQIDDDHLCFFIGDVSGKGISASLFMVITMMALKNHARFSLSPAQILADTNNHLCQDNPNGMFATVWLGILELSSGILTAANAGHECPVLLDEQGNFSLYDDGIHGLALGAFEDMTYTDYTVSMHSGSTIFLYTDGVPEAADDHDSFFGFDRMIDCLNDKKEHPLSEILPEITQEIHAFSKNVPQFDDITMVIMNYRSP